MLFLVKLSQYPKPIEFESKGLYERVWGERRKLAIAAIAGTVGILAAGLISGLIFLPVFHGQEVFSKPPFTASISVTPTGLVKSLVVLFLVLGYSCIWMKRWPSQETDEAMTALHVWNERKMLHDRKQITDQELREGWFLHRDKELFPGRCENL